MSQLQLFQNEPSTTEDVYPWEGIWDWQPEVGELAQIHSVILENQGYCFGDSVIINSIDGDDVVCTVKHRTDENWWKNGTIYHCKKSDLWPNIY